MMNQRNEVYHLIVEAANHPAWGINHCLRVYHLAKELSEPLVLDDEILYYSALLHDTGRYPKYALSNLDHALRSKGTASSILQRMAFPSEKLPKVLEAIEYHMYYSEPGRSDEAIYLRDADILDNLGNIGIMRLFSLVGQNELVPTIEAAIERARIFAEALPNKVYSKAGRRIAVKRREEMLRFLTGIKKQTHEFSLL